MLNIGMKLQYIIHVETLILEVMGVQYIGTHHCIFSKLRLLFTLISISLSRLAGLAKSSDKFVSKNFYA